MKLLTPPCVIIVAIGLAVAPLAGNSQPAPPPKVAKDQKPQVTPTGPCPKPTGLCGPGVNREKGEKETADDDAKPKKAKGDKAKPDDKIGEKDRSDKQAAAKGDGGKKAK